MNAARTIDTFATEVRIGYGLPGLVAIKYSDRMPTEGLLPFIQILINDFAQRFVRFLNLLRGLSAEHVVGKLVEGLELRFPIVLIGPAAVFEHMRWRNGQRVRVYKTTTTNATSVRDIRMTKQRELLHSIHQQLGKPEEAPELHIVLGEIFWPEALAHFEDSDRVPLLRETQRGRGSAKAGPDDDEVVIVLWCGIHKRRIRLGLTEC